MGRSSRARTTRAAGAEKGNVIVNTFLRKSGRSAAVVLGALALAAGAAACGGNDTEQAPEEDVVETTEEAPAEEEPAEESPAEEDTETTEAEETGEEGDDAAAGDEAAEPLTQDDLTAASERFVEYSKMVADGETEAACGLMLNPVTQEPFSGAELDACVTQMDSEEGVGAGGAEALDASMVTATDNGDGTASLEAAGTEVPFIVMTKGTDGQFYVGIAI